MLDTLLKIGQWQSEGKSEWDRFLEFPKVETQDKRENKITNYTLPIIFDLDEKEVIIEKSNLKEYQDNDSREYKLLSTRSFSPNSKKIYTTVKSENLKNLHQSLFGDSEKEGHLLQSISHDFPSLLSENFKSLLTDIITLKDDFINKTSIKDKGISIEKIKEDLELTRFENIVLIVPKIKSSKHGFLEELPFADIEDYSKFIEERLINKKSKNEGNRRLCYASGLESDDISIMDLERRDSLNKMFGSATYFSYLPLFDKKNAEKAYQVSERNKALLDIASNYLLDNKIYIADVRHCFIPEFLSNDDVDIEMALSDIKIKSDLVFSYRSLDSITREIKAWTDKPFWINFFALDIPRDKKYLKTSSIIKDVNIFYFETVIRTLNEVDYQLKDVKGINWESIRGNASFNLYSIFKLIPIRDENINKAYQVLKTILEARKIELKIIFQSFSELALCYYYNRFNSYSNQKEPKNEEHFKYSIKNITIKYLAFIQVLKKLNLINMEENPTSNTASHYEEAENEFFEKMKFTDPQKAMFFLGRMLNRVEFLQKDKKKTVIHKVNFNGMDRDDIERLRVSLIEKAKQYSAVGKVIFIDKKFTELFNYNNWNMNPQESTFFLLTGYSFGVGKKEAETLEELESKEA